MMKYIHPSEFLCDRQSQLNIFCEADEALQASIFIVDHNS